MSGTAPVAAADHARRRQVALRLIAGVVTLACLVGVAFCVFLATLMTYGLYSWQEPELDPDIWLPVVGTGVLLALGPLVMSLGARPRRWRIVALGVGLGGMVLLSLATWVRVALGLA